MATPLTTSEFLAAILAAIGGIDPASSVGGGVGTPDPSPSPMGTSTVNNWRSRGLAPQTVDNATGKRLWLVPAGREWQLMGLSATFQTSATAGNRQVEVFVNPGENNLGLFRHRYMAGAIQGPSLTFTYNFAMGEALLTAAYQNFLSVPLPPVILAASSSIVLWDRAQVAPLQAPVDAWSNVNLLILERVVA